MEKKRRRKAIAGSEIVLLCALLVYALMIIYPFYNAILISLISTTDFVKNPLMLIPRNVTFDAYAYLLKSGGIATGYRTTLIILAVGLPYNMLLTVSSAYALSGGPFPGKKFIIYAIYFTMFFSGGIVPLYLLVKSLSLTDTLWSVILPYGVNTFYMIIMRNYFESLPESMAESARIDGANDFIVLVRIIIPLSMPIMATVLLFFAVDRWNEWYHAMLFIKDGQISPLQLVLRNIITNAYSPNAKASAAGNKVQTFSQGIKMAAVVLTMTPIMLLYPFLQKYFTKGILLGAVKS